MTDEDRQKQTETDKDGQKETVRDQDRQTDRKRFYSIHGQARWRDALVKRQYLATNLWITRDSWNEDYVDKYDPRRRNARNRSPPHLQSPPFLSFKDKAGHRTPSRFFWRQSQSRLTLTSRARCHASYATCHASYATRHTSCPKRHTPCDMRHTSCAIRHTSNRTHVIRHGPYIRFSLLLSLSRVKGRVFFFFAGNGGKTAINR